MFTSGLNIGVIFLFGSLKLRILLIMYRPIFIILLAFACVSDGAKRREDKTKCPHVKAIRNFDLHETYFASFGFSKLLGSWYVVQYYASSEEALAYRCMRAEFTMTPVGEGAHQSLLEVNMNFTYSFTDDPLNERLIGNITWIIPKADRPAHWIHAEYTYEEVYNTYVLDSDYKSWALLLHCAEKSKSPRYFSSFIMSRTPELGRNVVSYLRDKLPRYDIDLAFMFDMSQKECDTPLLGPAGLPNSLPIRPNIQSRRHPMRRHHKKNKNL